MSNNIPSNPLDNRTSNPLENITSSPVDNKNLPSTERKGILRGRQYLRKKSLETKEIKEIYKQSETDADKKENQLKDKSISSINLKEHRKVLSTDCDNLFKQLSDFREGFSNFCDNMNIFQEHLSSFYAEQGINYQSPKDQEVLNKLNDALSKLDSLLQKQAIAGVKQSVEILKLQETLKEDAQLIKKDDKADLKLEEDAQLMLKEDEEVDQNYSVPEDVGKYDDIDFGEKKKSINTEQEGGDSSYVSEEEIEVQEPSAEFSESAMIYSEDQEVIIERARQAKEKEREDLISLYIQEANGVHPISYKVSRQMKTKIPEQEEILIGADKLIKGEKSLKTEDFNENYLIYYLNQASLFQFLNKKDIDNETKERLKLLALQGMGKAASIPKAEIMHYGRQVSPLIQTDSLYHRSGSNPFLEKIVDFYYKSYLSPVDSKINFIVIDNSKQVGESLAREGHFIPIRSEEEFENIVNDFFKSVVNNNMTFEEMAKGDDFFTEKDARHLWLDFTPLLAPESNPENVKEILNKLNDILTKQLEAAPPEQADSIAKFLMHFHPIAFINYEGQQVLLSPTMDVLTKTNFILRLTGKNQLACEHLEEIVNKYIHNMLAHTGGLPTMDGAKEALLKVQEPEQAPASIKNLKLSTYSTQDGKMIEMENKGIVCKNFSAFLNHPIVKRFKALSDIPDGPPYLKILPKVTYSLLEQLTKLSGKSDKIDDSFKEKGLTELLQMYYFGMLNIMAEANSQFPIDSKGNHLAPISQDNFMTFTNDIEALHQVIQNILGIVRPYDETALAQTAINNLKITPSGLPEPQVIPKASAMRSITSVMAGIEEQKLAQGEKKNINSLLMKDCYYETASVFHNTKYRSISLNGDKFNQDDEGTINDLSEQLEGQKIDLYVCEFEHNISLTRQSYQTEKVTEQVKALFKNNLAADNLTVFIDTTLNLENSEDIEKFLSDPEIHNWINEGKLNVVLNRSAQKFDMVGIDNYSGGILTIFNDGRSFASFNKRVNDKEDQLKGLSYQGLAHTLTCGEGIDQYRLGIMNNTLSLYKQLPAEMIFRPGSSNPIQIAEIQTDKPIFLDIKFGFYDKLGQAVHSALVRFAKQKEIYLSQRPSFGFTNSNVISIFDQDTQQLKIRLTPGLEDEKTIQEYAQFFNTVHDSLQQVLSLEQDKNTLQELDLKLADAINQLY